MKIFLAVIIVASIIGGFVGAEWWGGDFSITGAVVGGLGTLAVLLGLGAYFDSQTNKNASSPEMNEVFDRMFGKSKSQKNNEVQKMTEKPIDVYLSSTFALISAQIIPKEPRDCFGELMTNRKACGYVFGFHDSLLQIMGLANDKDIALMLMEKSYKNLFGEQAGFMLLNKSVNQQEDEDFAKGRMKGGNEIHQYLDDKAPPMGLGRLIVLGVD